MQPVNYNSRKKSPKVSVVGIEPARFGIATSVETNHYTRIASSTETKINKLMYLTIADCQPFNIFYNLTGCRSNSHCVMKKVYRRCYLHFPWICDFLQIILSDHSLAVSSMMLSFGYAHIYYKGKIFIHFQIFVYRYSVFKCVEWTGRATDLLGRAFLI